MVTKMIVQNSMAIGQAWTFRSLISEECHVNAASFITRCLNIKPKDNVMLKNQIMDEKVLQKVFYRVIKVSFKTTFKGNRREKASTKSHIRILLILLLSRLIIRIVLGNELLIKAKCCYQQILVFFQFLLFTYILYSVHLLEVNLMETYAGHQPISSPHDITWSNLFE